MNEDNLYPHSDDAGRVPGAMRDPFDLIAKAPPGAVYHSTESARKEERNRLVWEAMLVALPANIAWFDQQGGHIPTEDIARVTLNDAIDAADTYLAWRDEQ